MSAVRSHINACLEAFPSHQESDHDRQVSRRDTPPSDEPHRTDWPVAAEQEPPLASHVLTPRRGYLHHGIYVGGGKVVHYSGLGDGLRRGPVEEISLARFTRGRALWVRSKPSDFDCREVIRRARSRVGEDCYRLLSNNCEHFCEWCLRGDHRSYQVEALLARLARALQATTRLIARPFIQARRIGRRPVRSASRAEKHPPDGRDLESVC
jgi:hypothetical protein